jgi:hypothetical protein
MPSVEPSASALLALQGESRAGSAVVRAVEWFRSSQNPDGGWGFATGDDESNWHSAWAVLALQRFPTAQDMVTRGLDWLSGVTTSQTTRDDFSSDAGAPRASDPAVLAWPWLPSEATWIEPTSLAVLVFADFPSTPLVRSRLAAAVGYFEERRCPGGGWNVGNPVMFDSALPPRAHQTAWVLLALARWAPGLIREEDIQALRRDMYLDGGAPALAWGALALSALGEQDERALARLGQMQAQDGGWDSNIYHTAIAVLAGRGSL